MPAVELRPLTAADRAALAVEYERARVAGELRASSDADGSFGMRVFDLDPSIVGGAWLDDALVGFISSEFKVVSVRPEVRRRGIGRGLVDLVEGMERTRGRPDVILGRLPDGEAALGFLRATGFSFHSILWDLALPPDAVMAGPEWPAGRTARPFDRTRDVASWVALFNAAFADHATPLQLDPTAITAQLEAPDFVDEDTLLVEDDATGELVGFCALTPERREGKVGPRAEIWTIGVLPSEQGRGLGRQLLRWGVTRLREIGAMDIELSVNGRNERALGLYEREGFERRRTRERWARPVAAR
jgi:mycothiol synthase